MQKRSLLIIERLLELGTIMMTALLNKVGIGS